MYRYVFSVMFVRVINYEKMCHSQNAAAEYFFEKQICKNLADLQKSRQTMQG